MINVIGQMAEGRSLFIIFQRAANSDIFSRFSLSEKNDEQALKNVGSFEQSKNNPVYNPIHCPYP